VPQETILVILQEALSETRSELDELVDRLVAVYRGKESLEGTEQVVALGFLACARALREASLMQEIAVREELQELHRLASDILEGLGRIEGALEAQPRLRTRRLPEGLVEDLSPSGDTRARGRSPGPAAGP
jgi:hypothetical protein